MKKILLSISLLGATFAVGCGGSSGSSGGGGVVNCNTDADCNGNICNTNGHVCMEQCTASTDCPSTVPTCGAIPATPPATGNATDQQVCQCTASASTASCGASAVCNPVDLLCETPCTQNSDCGSFNPARTCINSVCTAAVVTPDAGTGCQNPLNPCATGMTCDETTGMCSTATCGTADTAGTCTAGTQYCDGTACQTPSTCAGPTASSTGPFIWSAAAATSASDPTDCTGGDNMIWTFTFNWYDSSASLPAMSSSAASATGLYENIFYLTSSGSIPANGMGNTATNNVSSTGTNTGTFSFQLCSDLAGTAVAVAVKDTAGTLSNPGCLPTF